MERKRKKVKGKRRRRVGCAHHLNEAVIRTHWLVDIEGSVGRNTLEHRLDVLLDLLMIKLPITKTVPSRGTFGTISFRRRAHRISGSTLLSWNMAMTPAPVTSSFTRRLTA
jgi:hypothetical protein